LAEEEPPPVSAAAGDDVTYTSAQIGQTDARFTLRVYTQATKRRERLSGAHLVVAWVVVRASARSGAVQRS
jgi:hypothetical protein